MVESERKRQCFLCVTIVVVKENPIQISQRKRKIVSLWKERLQLAIWDRNHSIYDIHCTMIEGLRIFFQVFLIGSRLAITEHTNNQPFVITPSYLSFLFAGRESSIRWYRIGSRRNGNSFRTSRMGTTIRIERPVRSRCPWSWRLPGSYVCEFMRGYYQASPTLAGRRPRHSKALKLMLQILNRSVDFGAAIPIHFSSASGISRRTRTLCLQVEIPGVDFKVKSCLFSSLSAFPIWTY